MGSSRIRSPRCTSLGGYPIGLRIQGIERTFSNCLMYARVRRGRSGVRSARRPAPPLGWPEERYCPRHRVGVVWKVPGASLPGIGVCPSFLEAQVKRVQEWQRLSFPEADSSAWHPQHPVYRPHGPPCRDRVMRNAARRRLSNADFL